MRHSKLIILVGALLFAGIAPKCVRAANPFPGKASPASPAKSKKKSRRSRRTRGQTAPTADRIAEIQRALARDGFLKGEPTGKWDANTAAAMQRFQGAHNLKPTGKLDALALQKLGLGSEIAGVAPPQPAIPSAPQTQRK
jgi:peptidoglycan hydrolase-like protein with peptidoglycan-binding domain